MPEDWLYSVRMRAADPAGRHLSGAERIVEEPEVPEVAAQLLARALDRGSVVEARISVDGRERSQVHSIPCLPVTDVCLPPGADPRLLLGPVCCSVEVSPSALDAGLRGLREGFRTDGAPTRGAVILDSISGARLDPHLERGVRARHFDYSPTGRDAARKTLEEAGLGHFRTFEALALASKVAWSGVLLELCWSDDGEYRPGYIATRQHGYLRLAEFKPAGAVGGRVFFAEGPQAVPEIIRRLEEEWTLVEPPVRVVRREA